MTLGRHGRSAGTRLGLVSIAVACVLASAIAVAAAEDATETTTFGKDGIASQSLGTHFVETRFSSVEARPDGGLVAQRDNGGASGPISAEVESFLANGAPDPAAPPQQLPRYGKVIPLASGKKLILGDAKLTRVNGDGSIDTSFGTGGTVKVSLSVGAAAELPNGETVLVSTSVSGTHVIVGEVRVELLNPNGSTAKAYGFVLPSYQELGVPEIALNGAGGALLVGPRFVIELLADGSPNPGFGGGGLVTDLPKSVQLAGGRVLPDGSVAAVGSGREPTGQGDDIVLLRLTSAGTPDPGFGSGGIRSFDLGGNEEARASLWAADNSVIVGGSARPRGSCFEAACEEVPLLVAFDSGGNLEPGFGSGGGLRLAALAGLSKGVGGNGVEALTRRPDGAIVAAGSSAPERTTAFLAALTPGGVLLPDFGEAGVVRLRQPMPAAGTATGLAALADGELLVAATTDVGLGDRVPVLIRYANDGSLDTSFGGGAGYVGLEGANFATGLAVSASGRVLAGVSGYPHAKLEQLRAGDGSRVPSFGEDGVVELPRALAIQALRVDDRGRALVVGARDDAGVVLSLGPDGKPDRGFGGDGTVELRTAGGRRVRAMALATGGGKKILVGGITRGRFALTRLLPDGRPDPRFGSGGWALANVDGRPLPNRRRSVALGRAGSRTYLAGATRDGGATRLVLLRFRADGRLDSSFGHGGRRVAAIAKGTAPTAVLPSPSGVLVVLDGGPRPLLSFGRHGKVRRRPLIRNSQPASNVRATVSRGQLVLGWNGFDGSSRRNVFYLGRRPLDGR